MQSSVYTADVGAGTAQGLVGRAGDVERIEGLLGSVDSGGAVLLTGDPGAGKTALLGHLALRALAAGARVLRAAGTESESGVEYAALNQLLFPLWEEDPPAVDGTHSAALRVALGFGEGAPPERFLVSNAALVLLRRAAAATPILLVVDDLQAVDPASAAVLGFVARRLAGSRVRFLAARRGRRGRAEAGVRVEYEVLPLDEGASRLLASASHPDLSAPVVECVVAAAQGNPLALVELPAALTGPQRAGLERRPAALPLTRRLREVFGSCVAGLPAATRRLLLVPALEGTGDLAVLQCAAQRLGAGADLADLEAAERDGLVRIEEFDHRMSFRHPLYRAAVVDASTSAERRRVHRELAEVLHDRPDQRAWHLGEACVEQDEDVAALLEGTAHRVLRRGDAMAAIRSLTKAAHLSPGAADRGRRLAAAAYIRADASGELTMASRLLDDARRFGSDDRASLYSAAVAVHRLLDGEGDIDTAHQILLGAIENGDHPHGACDPALEEALYLLLLLCCLGGRAELWAPLHKILERLGPDAPRLLAVNVATQGDPARTALPAMGDLEELIAGLPQETAPSRITRIGTAGIATDRLTGVRDAVSRVPSQGRRQIVTLPLLCTDAFLAGRWDDTTQLADEGLRLCKEHAFEAVSWYFLYYKAVVAAARGEAGVAEETADAMGAWGTSRGAHHLVTLAEHIRVLVAQAEGDFERAYRHAAAISPPGELAPYTPVALLVVGDVVEAAVRTQRPAEAAAHVAAARHAGIAALSPRRAMLVDASSAMAAEADEEAIGLFERALAHPGVQQWPFDLARVTLAYGERLRKARSTTDARASLSAALATFEQLGARPWADRAKRTLQATGWMVKRADGPESVSLTPQELEIAHLAASGLTNKQIAERLYLSPRTVGGHLGRVFPKLGITSRAALRDALTGLAKR
ncbi:AAA family ATPase [Actinacidiphila glaucinigra]|uniref:AAA family ATPase n=1 Tax=Actinacidiphila glaucinigra TaxID=235986 RepID=UPI002DD7A0B7|nr:AAA family ATPase [Actinacidiphila glaucinigra]WSD63774.1 AAA family ATPase [Actinacidiphila glaucinigra]